MFFGNVSCIISLQVSYYAINTEHVRAYILGLQNLNMHKDLNERTGKKSSWDRTGKMKADSERYAT